LTHHSAVFLLRVFWVSGRNNSIRGTFETFIDPRTGKNSLHTMVDAGLSAFSVFFMQSPSFLEYQRTLAQAHGENNARTLFGVHEIPSDNPIRTLPDASPQSLLKPVYSCLFNDLRDSCVVDSHRSLNGSLLLAFDGTENFSSQLIHSGQCSTRQHANGTVTHSHAAVTPVLVKPGCDFGVPLAPEFVTPPGRGG
jgi:hypothetical protein